MALRSGKLTKNLMRTVGAGRHGDGSGLYLVVDASGARRRLEYGIDYPDYKKMLELPKGMKAGR